MLHHARKLEIWNNPQALRNLLAYAEGEYQLDRRWERKPLGNLSVEVDCPAGGLPAVEQLRRHIRSVTVCKLTAPLGAENAVTVDCLWCTFTESRAVGPRSLVVDASVKHCGVEFLDAEGEVSIPELAIGPRGDLEAVIYNNWGYGMAYRCFSLLWHAKALTIRGNPSAVRNLAAYVAGVYDTGNSLREVRPLSKGLRLTIEGAAGCEAEIGALAEHFGVITVDGRRVPGATRRRLLADCNGREGDLSSLRAEAEGRRRALGRAAGALAGKRREVERARPRLRELRRRLDALVRVALWAVG